VVVVVMVGGRFGAKSGLGSARGEYRLGGVVEVGADRW